MKKFEPLKAIVAPMDRTNVDTDLIIPKNILKSIKRTGFGAHLFDQVRYLDEGYPDQDCSVRPVNYEFPLNYPRYQGAKILLTRENFGCGSSREHAPWALDEYGFRVLIAPSFAEIFFNNCFKNGLLPIVLDSAIIDRLFEALYENEGFELVIDLHAQTVITPSGESFEFDVDEFRKRCLLEGLDDICLTLQKADLIRDFESRHRSENPWLYGALKGVSSESD